MDSPCRCERVVATATYGAVGHRSGRRSSTEGKPARLNRELSGPLRFAKAGAPGAECSIGAVSGVQFEQDVGDVIGDGAWAEIHRRTDRDVALSVCEVAEHF